MKQQKQRKALPVFARMLRQTFVELNRNDPLRMAGATAFFTTFALPPILIILIQVLGLVINPRLLSRQLFTTLSGIVGRESVQQIVDTLIAFRQMAQNWAITIGGFLFLMFVATTLFKIIKGSINQLWKMKVVERRGFWKGLRSRGKSILVILFAGVLFIIGVIAEGAQAYMGQYISELSPALGRYFNSLLSYLLSIVIVTIWFAIVFRYLPDGRPLWKVAFVGGLLTSILFNIGKFVLRWLLTYSNINNVYGASGSIVLLLLFVFYASLILYFGAMFTKVWAMHHQMPIRPRHYAMHYHLTRINADED